VARVLNTRTRYYSPQYHILQDDSFTTVTSVGAPQKYFSPMTWYTLLKSGYERYLENTFDHPGHSVPPPMINNEWLTGLERVLRDQIENELLIQDLISRFQSQREQTLISEPVLSVSGGGGYYTVCDDLH
jgi:hypothetical protein